MAVRLHEQAKFAVRRDRALATVVLTVDTSLLYLIGEPEDPVIVWKKLANQFEKRHGQQGWTYVANCTR